MTQKIGVDLVDASDYIEAPESTKRQARVRDAMQRELLSLLDGGPVVLVYPIPEAGWHIPKVASRAVIRGIERDFSTSHALYKTRNADVIKMFDEVSHPNLYRVFPETVFCDSLQPGRCATMLDGQPLYKDDDHLSRAGSALLSKEILDVIATIPMEPDA